MATVSLAYTESSFDEQRGSAFRRIRISRMWYMTCRPFLLLPLSLFVSPLFGLLEVMLGFGAGCGLHYGTTLHFIVRHTESSTSIMARKMKKNYLDMCFWKSYVRIWNIATLCFQSYLDFDCCVDPEICHAIET